MCQGVDEWRGDIIESRHRAAAGPCHHLHRSTRCGFSWYLSRDINYVVRQALAQRLSFSCMLAIFITSDRSCLFRKYWPRQDSMLIAFPNTLSSALPMSRTNLHIQKCSSNSVVGRFANGRPQKQYLSAVAEVNSIAEFGPTRVAHRSACRGFCKLISVSVETFLHEAGGNHPCPRTWSRTLKSH